MSKKIHFSSTDRIILESYAGLMGGLADYLGPGFEIVLHSLEDMSKSVIAIVNGHYTGRKIGSPATDLALDMLSKIESNASNDYISYFNTNKSGEPLRSTTIAIRGENNKVIGLLCMNMYLNTPVFNIVENWFNSSAITPNNATENLAENADELLADILHQVQQDVYTDNSIYQSNKNKEIIARLYSRGIFRLKDAVITVAKQLHISRNTVYMHLRNLEKS